MLIYVPCWIGLARRGEYLAEAFDEADVRSKFPNLNDSKLELQPLASSAFNDYLNRFSRYLGQYLKNDPPPKSATDVILNATAKKVAIEDQTSDALLGRLDLPSDPAGIFDLLKKKGFKHAGCFYVTSSTNAGQSVEVVVFLAKAEAQSADVKDAKFCRVYGRLCSIKTNISFELG